ncbi:HIT domain-containing protein [Thalassotalea marina]|uniref:Histidine triad domain protein n=1 Tax=Thalassotalea marina TaxID=1673741 RepID=A0A919BLA2_9GAMM|nr:HIT domain-containing protein [Thalassotalea marina]GHF96644.1 histidine triad domain protein [Thalassotalea marina]
MEHKFELNEILQRDTIEIIDFPLCKLLLMNDSQYPWFVLVPRVNGIEDIYQMEWQEQQQFLNESSMLSEVLMQLFKGTKMNVAALGNVCPQLHIHHVVRFNTDKAWPKPVWGQFAMQPYTEPQIEEIKAKLLPQFAKIIAK